MTDWPVYEWVGLDAETTVYRRWVSATLEMVKRKVDALKAAQAVDCTVPPAEAMVNERELHAQELVALRALRDAVLAIAGSGYWRVNGLHGTMPYVHGRECLAIAEALDSIWESEGGKHE
jgi:hypothetical protein